MKIKAIQKLIDKLRGKVALPPEEHILDLKEVARWFKDKGDETHRINYPLDENSIVFDVGGYCGSYAATIFCKYACEIHIFEPVQDFFQSIQRRFSNNAKVINNDFGLADENMTVDMGLSDDASGLYEKTSTLKEQCKLVSITDYMQINNIECVDLIKINIEGGEYALLEKLLSDGKIKFFKNIQVQFHEVCESSEKRMEQIQEKLRETHILTYCYRFCWENWQRKG